MQHQHRIYVMAAPCGGKSTFAARGSYKTIRLVDFNVHFDHWARETSFDRLAFSRATLQERERVYNQVNIAYLHRQAESVCMLGVIGPERPERYPQIAFVVVQPPIPRAFLFCMRRKWEVRNKKQNKMWSKLGNVGAYRRKLSAYAKKYGLPIYPTFEKALDAVLDNE